MIENWNIMIHDKILGWKSTIYLKVVLEFIQLIVRSRAFYSVIFKTKSSFQEVISLYSFDKILISNTPWTQKMSLEDEEIKRFKD